MTQIGEHAVVIGASVAGLLAARALADFYEQVTVVERDVLPAARRRAQGSAAGPPRSRAVAARAGVHRCAATWLQRRVGCRRGA